MVGENLQETGMVDSSLEAWLIVSFALLAVASQ